jgi:hypothetical protein
MRRTLGIVLFVGFAGTVAGCFNPSGKQTETAATAGPPSGDKEHTLDYWSKVRAVMKQKSAQTDNLQQVSSMVEKQAVTIRQLSIDGVDRDLYVAANALAQHQEKVIEVASKAAYTPSMLRADPDLQKTYLRESQQIVAAEENLKALRAKLSARYGVTFPPLEEQQ